MYKDVKIKRKRSLIKSSKNEGMFRGGVRNERLAGAVFSTNEYWNLLYGYL